ncbi:uracil-xanthine permease family protein [Serpentinicella alkaliphila]|uniref:Uracil permease n=1 Tax=Serpentinicella alkaliphila TaxID=1734049 RepID=A0A4R2T9P4_9FIRM|nr:solute carrier family 23 protein [Serpentinicella alkaliphila]QUH26125.1 uracil permease [Serpentinicella alkaliphila]TCP98426.1 uracil permease [Serpentinicella alkaliphila]
MSNKEGLRKWILAVQHILAMFGATVLVPMLTGLNPAVALLAAGGGTLLFHLITKGKVPVFLGSSFAFIPVIIAIREAFGGDLRYAQGGIIVAGAIYIALAACVKIFGIDKVKSFFPPIVTGPMIIVIGLTLSPVAIGMASTNWGIALVVLATVIIVSVYARGFMKLLPIIISVFVGYVVSILTGVIDLATLSSDLSGAALFAMPAITMPKFDIAAIAIMAPIVLVVFMEHIGDITTNGAVVGQDFFKDPGLHRTLLGDGIATMFAGFIGGPANTTYGENTGVLAVTKVYDPSIIRLAAAITLFLSFIGKFEVILRSIPVPVMGGISIVLFGMIASIGLRTMVEAELDFSESKNLLIAALILVIGIGTDVGGGIYITESIQLAGLSLAAITGIVANKLINR